MRMSKTKIAHVITGLDLGGAEMMLWKLLSASTGNWDHVVVSLSGQGPMTSRIAELGVPVHSMGLRSPISNPFGWATCIGLIRRMRPQMIQGWMPHGNLAASGIQMASGVPARVAWNIRMSVSGIRNEKSSTRAVIRLGAAFSWHPAAIVYNSRIGAQQHEAIGYRAARCAVIPNGFDCEVFRPDAAVRREVRSEFGLEQDSVLIGLIARYHPMKDHANFVRAASLVASTLPGVHFVLVGNGIIKKQSKLSALIREMNLDARFILLDERDDIRWITAALDVACSASAWGEGFSNALGEAMACGVPCVATDVGDTRSIVADTGFVVPPRAPEAMAHAICDLIRWPERRKQLGFAARKRIQSEFSLPQVVRRYETLYAECLAVPQELVQPDLAMKS
jgi:glycosyltransferase involved in cell wall biosynthesis